MARTAIDVRTTDLVSLSSSLPRKEPAMLTIGLNVRSVTRRSMSSAAVAIALALYATVTIASGTSAQVTGRDFDHDGLTDDFETNHTGTLWGVADTDDDLLTDGEEINIYRTDPRNDDSDRDMFGDGQEIKHTRTNPLSADTDGDGFTELEEHNAGTDPTNAGSSPAAAPIPVDPVPVPDLCDAPQEGVDSDGDGMLDPDECGYFETDPNNPDTDGDGSIDGAEDEKETNPNDPNDF